METQEKRVGVFMLVFRNEPTMHRAVKSILDQTYTNFKFYILTSEATRPIMLEYAKQDARIQVMDGIPGESFITYAKDIAKENAYITILDADDWCATTYIEDLLQEAESRGVDIVACGNYFISEKQEIVGIRAAKELEWSVSQTNRNLRDIYVMFRTIWGKLIRSGVILACDFNLLPPVNTYGVYGHDTLIAFLMLTYAERLYLCDKVLYNYQMSKGGESYKIRKGRLDSDEVLFHFVEKLLVNLGDYGELERYILLKVYYSALKDTLRLVRKADLPESNRVDKFLYLINKDLTREILDKENVLFLEFGREKGNEIYVADLYSVVFHEELREIQEEQVLCGYKEILEKICPKVKGVLTIQEFKLLLTNKRLLDALIYEQYHELIDMLLELFKTLEEENKDICKKLLLRLSTNKVFSAALQEEEILLNHIEIIQMISRGENENAVNEIKTLLFAGDLPQDAELLVNLWAIVAAITETEEEFVLAKQTKVEILWIQNKKEDAKIEYQELCELGVLDDNMTYLEKMLY